MMTSSDLASVPSDPLAPFTDQLRLAVAAYLGTRPPAACGTSPKPSASRSPGHIRTCSTTHAVTTMLDAGVELRDVQIAARQADPRTTVQYDRARQNLDRHPDYILAACAGIVPGGSPAAGAIQAWQQDWPGKLAATTRQHGKADLGSVAWFVLEGELELGAIGDRPALVQGNVLLDDLGHPQIAERPGGGPDRLRRGVFP
jgi:hypothetical protein